MAKHIYAIMGATGHVGQVVAEELLKKGHKVRALGREAHKLAGLKAKGAEIVTGDFTDIAFLTKAFKGCNAVFSMLPPGYAADDMDVLRDKVAEAIVQAIAHAKITHVVNLSSLGADLSTGTGPIKELHREEERLNLVPGLNVLHLRAGYFMENLLWAVPAIKSSGTISGHLKANLPIPMVATHDIGQKIAAILDTLKFKGSSYFDFVGPDVYTMTDVITVLGKATGKSKLKYKELPFMEAEQAMIESGMKHQLAKSLVEMYSAFNEGKIKPTQQLTAEHKGKTTLEEFAKVFADMYRSMKKAA